MTQIKAGDKFKDKNLIGSPAVVTAVGVDGTWVEPRWMQGAPAYRYSFNYAERLLVR